MIKVTINDLLNGTEALQKLSQKELKARPALAISRLLKAADKEIQDFNEVRLNLIKKFGEKDEQGELITDENNNCKILQEGITEFTAQLNDLIATEVEINANKIDLESLGDVEFTPAEIAMLEPFLVTEEETE